MAKIEQADAKLILRMLASGSSQQQVADTIGVSQRAISAWVAKHPGLVTAVREQVETDLVAYAIKGTARDRDKRIAAMEERLAALQAYIEANKQTYDYTPQGRTGLVVRDYKAVAGEVVETWALDTGLLSEMRAHERAIAEETGQLAESKQVNINIDARQVIVREIGGVDTSKLL